MYSLWNSVKWSGGGEKLRRRHGDPLNGRVGGRRALKVYGMGWRGFKVEIVYVGIGGSSFCLLR